MEQLKVRFVEYGKVFFRKGDDYIAGDFKILNFSDQEICQREKAFRDILRYPDRSSFSPQYGRVSLGLFKNRDFNEYIFVHIQRRRELERAPGIKGLPNRGYNQLRFYVINEDKLNQLFAQKKNFMMSLIMRDQIEYDNTELNNNFKLYDYPIDEVGETGIQSEEKSVYPYEIESKDNLEYIAVQIANFIIDRFEMEKPRLPYLKFSLPANVDGVGYKLKIVQQVQAIVFPRVGIITFAFDDISEQQVNILLLDFTSNTSNVVISLESASPKNSETRSSDLIIENLDIVYQEIYLNILRNSDISFREALFFILYVNKKLKLDETTFNQIFAKAKVVDRDTYCSVILDKFEIIALKSLFGNSKIDANIKLNLLAKYLGKNNNTLLFLELYFDLPNSERLNQSFCKVMADSLQYADMPRIREVKAEICQALIQLILSQPMRAELSRGNRYWSDKKPVNAIEIATYLDFDAAKEAILKIASEEGDATFRREVTTFALSQSDIGYLHWVINSLKVEVEPQKLVDYLLACFDKGGFSTKDEIDCLCSIISGFNKGTNDFLSLIPRTINGKALENRIYDLIEVSAQIVEKVFLGDIIKLGYPELQPKYLEMRKRVPNNLKGYTSDCVRYLFCRTADDPILEFLERDCEFTKEERMRIALVLVNDSEFLLSSDIVYIFSKAPESGYVNFAKIIILRDNEKQRILDLPKDVIVNFILAILALPPNEKDYKGIEDNYRKIMDRLQIIFDGPEFWSDLLNQVLGNLALSSFQKMIGELKLEVRNVLFSTDDGKKLLDLNELLVIKRDLINKHKDYVFLIKDILFENKSLSDIEDDTEKSKEIREDLIEISNGNSKFFAKAKAALEGAKTQKIKIQNPQSSSSQEEILKMDKVDQIPQPPVPLKPNTITASLPLEGAKTQKIKMQNPQTSSSQEEILKMDKVDQMPQPPVHLNANPITESFHTEIVTDDSFETHQRIINYPRLENSDPFKERKNIEKDVYGLTNGEGDQVDKNSNIIIIVSSVIIVLVIVIVWFLFRIGWLDLSQYLALFTKH